MVRDTIFISGKQKYFGFVNFEAFPARPSGKCRCKSLRNGEVDVMEADGFEVTAEERVCATHFGGESFLFISDGLQYGRMSILLGGLYLERTEKLTPGFW